MSPQQAANKMKKYYIGLAVIGLFTCIVLIVMLAQGASTKQDRITYNKANDIASELNDYIASNRKIPESLAEAGIKDEPSTITYTKDSEAEYTFCATYKQARSSVSTPDLLSGSAVRSGALYDDYDDYSYTSSYKASALYPTYNYKKGENCQTIKPYLYSTSTYQPSTINSNPVNTYTNTQAKARDVQRFADINAMHSKLEEYYNENGSYPATFTSTTFSGIDAQALVDANGKTIVIAKPALSETAALAVKSPTATENYLYVPYACSGNACDGYVLKTYIEIPNASSPNPYTKKGLNNI